VEREDFEARVTRVAHLFGVIGPVAQTAFREVLAALDASNATPLFGPLPPMLAYLDEMGKLADEFRQLTWDEAAVVKVIRAEIEKSQFTTSGLADVRRWVRAHEPSDSTSVRDCVFTTPPAAFSIDRVLSRAGSQKLVFRASAGHEGRKFVLKKLRGTPEDIARIFSRERLANPLWTKHPNIIETHFERNQHDEVFVVERLLQDLLSDNYRAQGSDEGAQLLYDILSALSHLHERGFVHGDVKPDNIGRQSGTFILLDFGICRPVAEFADAEQTGSLRTRAPELLLRTHRHSPASDVWALAATLCSALGVGFPFLEPGDAPPKGGPARSTFQRLVEERAKDASTRIAQTLDQLGHSPLVEILRGMLDPNPDTRTTAESARRALSRDLAYSVAGRDAGAPGPQLSPEVYARMLLANAPAAGSIRDMPSGRQEELLERVRTLSGYMRGASETMVAELDALEQLILREKGTRS
jgi:serine/threonine protein kinase